MKKVKKNFEEDNILKELYHHIPFTGLATLVAIILTIFVYSFGWNKSMNMEGIFHILHPMHVFLSVMVSSGIYYKYKKNILNAVLIGVIVSIIIGSLSEVILPYLGSLVFNMNSEFHLPLIEMPLIIISVALIGSFIGVWKMQTKLPHLLHVFISVFASLFYLLAYTQISFIKMIFVFVIVFLGVIIPCCLSDIVFPLLFVKKKLK
jgi:hypothetical protein